MMWCSLEPNTSWIDHSDADSIIDMCFKWLPQLFLVPCKQSINSKMVFVMNWTIISEACKCAVNSFSRGSHDNPSKQAATGVKKFSTVENIS